MEAIQNQKNEQKDFLYLLILQLRMQKYSGILSGLKEITTYCNQRQFKEQPIRSLHLCIENLSGFFQQYIQSQSSKQIGSSELRLPNIKGEISKDYVDKEINDVKTIIEKKILGLNIYENKIQKINEDIRRQFDRKAAQLTDKTKQFQKILEQRMNKIQIHLHQTLYEFDKKIQGNLTKQQNKVIKTVDDKMKTQENNFTNDLQKLYTKITQLQKNLINDVQKLHIKTTQLEKRNWNGFSPQKRQIYPQKRQSNGISQEQYQMNNSGVKFNTKRIGQDRISTADRKNQSRLPNKDNAYNYREQQLRRNMVSQPKKIADLKVLKSHIGSFGMAPEIKQPLKRNIQVRNWVDPSYAYQKLILERNMIIAQQPTFIFSRKQIKDGYSFCVSLLKKTFAVGLGIADSRYRKVSSVEDIKSKIIYFADGDFWEGSQKKSKSGNGFKQQQCVTVTVNSLFSTIQWKVGGEVRFRSRSHLITEKNYLVPFIFLGAKDASVGIAQQ